MSHGYTIAEKIIGAHTSDGAPVAAGEIVVADVDLIMAQDGNAPLAIKILDEEFGGALADPSKTVLVIDHCGPSPDMAASNLQRSMRDFVDRHGAHLFDVGSGISHVVLPESGFASPGGLVLGSDSHSVTYGALNCLGTGMGSTDIAVAMHTGQTWLRVPETIKVILTGALKQGSTAKDAVLTLIDEIGVDGATYASLEFGGDGLRTIGMDGRMTLCNMGVEMGAKCALMPIDEVAADYLSQVAGRFPERQLSIDGVTADHNAHYSETIELDLSSVQPLVVTPHDLTDISPVEDVSGQRIDQAFIGTCTNSRIEDLRAAAEVLRGHTVARGVRLIVTPGSKSVMEAAVADGTMSTLLAAGAVITTPGCGACVGTHQGVPADGEVVISTANRNFRGRMGNPSASILLGSPETVAASAVMGRVAGAGELS